jgi:hypothetical protein
MVRQRLDAAQSCASGQFADPLAAWNTAALNRLPTKMTREKGCPKSAFLGLCEEGRVKGVARGSYTRSKLNKGYALQALTLLSTTPALAGDCHQLWKRVMAGVEKQPNHQMEVVIALWEAGLTNPPR